MKNLILTLYTVEDFYGGYGEYMLCPHATGVKKKEYKK